LRPAADAQTPQSDAARMARHAVVAYAHGLADSFDNASRQIDAGKWKTAVEVNRALQSSNGAARKEAFRELDAFLNDEIGGDQWDAKRAGRLFQEMAREFRSFR
jgi:hypothetical protein